MRHRLLTVLPALFAFALASGLFAVGCARSGDTANRWLASAVETKGEALARMARQVCARDLSWRAATAQLMADKTASRYGNVAIEEARAACPASDDASVLLVSLDRVSDAAFSLMQSCAQPPPPADGVAALDKSLAELHRVAARVRGRR